MSLLTVFKPTNTAVPIERDRQTAIRLENVSVCYQVSKERIISYKEYVLRRLQGKVRHQPFLALQNVDLTVGKGEVFGIIGHNGAGKSTLLKLLARVLRPTEGRVWVQGQVAPLLDIGAGFHPELTGRENVFLNGTLLGFTRRDIQARFNRIVAFAEIEDFIDAPLRAYSSGMMVRLGFAVATDVQPDILLVDEVLAVGDEAFQRKCFARIEQFQQQGTTILLVSHTMSLIEKMCHRVAWLDHGQVKAVGAPAEIIELYRESQPQ